MVRVFDNKKSDDEVVIPIDSGITRAEAHIIAKLIHFGLKWYGEPEFSYFNVDENRFEDVDFWRNLIKVGRETGPGSGKRRIGMLESLVSDPVGGVISPNQVSLDWAIKQFSSMYKCDIKSVDKKSMNVTYSTEKSTTNSGEPYYTRKSKSIEGVPVRKLIADRSNSLDLDEMAQLPAFLGARSQRGKWSLKTDRYTAVEELVKDISLKKLSLADTTKLLIESIGFDHFKARIISAAPSIDAYNKSSLMFPIIQAEKDKFSGNSSHLGGPLAVRDMLAKNKAFAEKVNKIMGLKLEFYNADATKYDQTLRKEHAQWAYDAVECRLPLYKDKAMLAYMFMANIVRPILYIESPVDKKNLLKHSLKELRVKQTLRSGEVDTNFFGSTVIYLCIQAARHEATDLWVQINDLARKDNVGLIQTDGDDNLTAYICDSNNSIESDLTNTTNILESKYGLLLQDPLDKGERGYFYTQFRLTYDNRFITPLSRMRLYWKETSRAALPPYTYVVSLYQNLEFRKGCKGVVEYIREFILPYDDTRLGYIDRENGNNLSFNEFRIKIRHEAKQYGLSESEMLFKGNPYNEHIINDKGSLNEDWLREQWEYWRAKIYNVSSKDVDSKLA